MYLVMPSLAKQLVYQRVCESIHKLAMPHSVSDVPRGGWRRGEYVFGHAMPCCASDVSKSVCEHTYTGHASQCKCCSKRWVE